MGLKAISQAALGGGRKCERNNTYFIELTDSIELVNSIRLINPIELVDDTHVFKYDVPRYPEELT